MTRNTCTQIVVALAVSLTPALAFAAGGDSELVTTTIFHTINLAALIAILIAVGRKPVGEFLAARKAKITHDLEEAARLRAEAAQLLSTYESQISGLAAERTALMDDYRSMGEAERDRIIASANKEADRIARETENAMEREITRARAALESEVVELAAQIAERTLREKLDARGHAKLVDSYVADLGSEA